MSRLIIKNLPNNITTDKLKSLFGQKGEITDVQLKYTKDGKFRNFGFVGYKKEEFANAAKEFFNGSCIKTNRIIVETCVALGNAEKPKAWSKYAPESSTYKKIHGIKDDNKSVAGKVNEKKLSKEERRAAKEKERNKMIKQILKKHKNDPLFAEFLEVHAHKDKKSLWGNDTEAGSLLDHLSSSESEDDKEDGDSGAEKDEEEHEIQEETNKISNKEKKKIANEAVSDLEYMKSLIKKNEKSKKKTEESKSDENKSESEAEKSDNEKESDNNNKSKKKKEPRNRVLFFVKLQGLPFSCKKRDIKDFFKPLVPFTIRIPRCTGKVTRGFCYVGFRSEEERKKALFKNKSFISGHRVIVNRYENKANIEEDNEKTSDSYKRKNQEESLKYEESIAESGRIYVRNLPYVSTENEVQELFEKFGPVAEVNLPVDKLTHQPKGFCHVTYMMPEHAVKAYTELDGSIFCGRMLHLLPGKQKDERAENEEGLTYKQKKEKQQKQQSGSSHNWNTLFLGANAVADVIADTYHTTKEKLLEGNEQTSGAVRLALGETQLVLKTKKFLEENGVSLDAFNQPPKKRSKNVILVKNMPAKSTYDEVLKLFEPFGLISRLIMPPHGITALVEFVEPSEARQAFSKLAYSKFKYLPLYLEWAPDNVFLKPAEPNCFVNKASATTDEKSIDSNQNKKNIKEVTEVNKVEEVEEENAEDSEEETPEADTTLFVKGLHFDTREDALKKHFSKCGRIYSVTIAMKKDPHNPGQKLSMGYGFVQFYAKNSAEKALKNLQFSTLDEKQIELKRSERTGSGEVKTAKKSAVIKKQTGTKILVRNIPFQANQREVQEIFGTFGEIKALRMPKKLQPGENQHRGFCFVEYYNKGDAKNAFQALCQSTHLYGRRLVLEWAKLNDDSEMLDTIRKRTSELFYQDTPGGKKNRKATLEAEEPEEDE